MKCISVKLKNKKLLILALIYLACCVAVVWGVAHSIVPAYHEYDDTNNNDGEPIIYQYNDSNPVVKKIDLYQLADLAKESIGKADKIYLHWSASPYECYFNDYHINIDGDGSIYQTCHKLTDWKNHITEERCGHSIAIALDCGYGAESGSDLEQVNFGDYPPTLAQLESLAKVLAVLSKNMDIPIKREYIMTHGEAADEDGYGVGSEEPDTRWDMQVLPVYIYGQAGQRVTVHGGEFIRNLAKREYKRI